MGRTPSAVSDTVRSERHVLADRLHSLAIHLLRRIRRGDDAAGLSAPRLSALSVIIYRGPISLTELAKAEGVTAPTMTRLVQALVRAGFSVLIDSEGIVKIVDRAKDLVKSGGEWISSVDIENSLMAHPAVREAAVSPVRRLGGGRRHSRLAL